MRVVKTNEESINPFEKVTEYKGGDIYWKRQKWISELYDKQSRCLICNSKNDLTPHHTIKAKNYERLYYNKYNGVLMCRKCHNEYHKFVNDNGLSIDPLSLVLFVKSKK